MSYNCYWLQLLQQHYTTNNLNNYLLSIILREFACATHVILGMCAWRWGRNGSSLRRIISHNYGVGEILVFLCVVCPRGPPKIGLLIGIFIPKKIPISRRHLAPKVLYMPATLRLKCRQYSTFAPQMQTVQHFCASGRQKCCTVC